MCSDFPYKRPNCEEVLKKKQKWALNEREFEINDELKNMIASEKAETEFTIYLLLRSKLNSDKVIETNLRQSNPIKSNSKRVHNCVIS